MGGPANNNHNPIGRPKGSRNRRTQDLVDLLNSRGDKDPLEFLSEVVSTKNGEYAKELKIQAANYLAPYMHPKYGTKIIPRYIDEPITLPHADPTSIEQTNANINYISAGMGDGRIDFDFANSLITSQRAIASNLIAEEELKIKSLNAGAIEHDTTIRIEGGLPALPGTSITMPILNGHTIDGTLIDQSTASDPSQSDPSPTTLTDPSPPKDQSQ